MEAYITLAKEFCAWAETLRTITEENAGTIVVKIMEIYIASAHLQDPEKLEDCDASYEQKALYITDNQTNTYWEIFTPHVLEEPVCGSLVDDITSIYNEIREGILLFERGHYNDAVWHWRWAFENHWKYHAVDAIRALANM